MKNLPGKPQEGISLFRSTRKRKMNVQMLYGKRQRKRRECRGGKGMGKKDFTIK